MISSTKAIEVTNVTTQYGDKIIHNDISFSIKKNTICSLIGGSGSGKTTLLRALIGLLKPHKGKIKILGKDILSLSMQEEETFKKKMSVLFQEGALFSGLTVLDNIIFPLNELQEIPKKSRESIGSYMLNLVGLDNEVLFKVPSELSGGMKKRVGLARALVLEPEILFLDEPTSGLDPISARHFNELVIDLKEKLNTTIVMISHDIESICSISEQIIALADSKIIADGATEQVIRTENPWLKEYFKTYLDIKS